MRSNLAYVIYTSGSTGRPNGVTTTHRSAVHLIRQAVEQFQVDENSRILQSVSFSFDASVLETWMALSTGATLCVADAGDRLAGDQMAGLIRREGITTAVLTPVTLASLPVDGVPSLRVVSVGGEACPAEVVNRWTSGLDRLLNCYGPTETTIYASSHLCSGTYRTVPPIGRPVGRTRMYVVDSRGIPVPVGVPGELLIGGDGLSMGYLNRPELTAARFIPDPFGMDPGTEPGARLYRTGDLVRRLAGGELEFLGRVDRQVKLRGLRIELGEIEAALGRHPAVRDTAVVVHHAGGDPRLVACLVPSIPNDLERADLEPEISSQLRAHLLDSLPDYMVPSSFLFLESLPLTPTGKVDRKALALLEPDAGVELARVAPRDLLELELVGLWQEVLGKTLGIRDDFFATGGHSLLAVRLMARVKERFGRELPLAVLFQGGTVEAMAALLRKQEATTSSCLVPIQPAGSGLPFFCVHPAGGDVLCFAALARHLGSGRPFYGLRSRGLAEGEAPLERIEDMAALYVEELRRVQPAGPYRIGGWSLGGLIAFEMARQLHQAGVPAEEIDLLILDSSPRVAGPAGTEEPSRLAILLDVALYVETLWNRPLGLTADDLAPLDPEARLDLLVDRLRAADLLPPEAGEAGIRRIVEVYAANTRAVRLYKPGRWVGRLTLFQAGPLGDQSPDDLGWSDISQGPVDVQTVPASHLTLLVEPAVARLGQQIRARLEDAEPVPVLKNR